MLKIRLSRLGKKKQPYYRIIISEQSRDTYGRALEILGTYNPKNKKMDAKQERIKYWLAKGAKISSTLHNLFISHKIIEGKKVTVTHIKKAKKKGGEKSAGNVAKNDAGGEKQLSA